MALNYHHIGIAVHSISCAKPFYESIGYKASDIVYDSIQNVSICFLMCEGKPMIELLQPVDESSPVSQVLHKVGASPYHICYEVDDLEAEIVNMRRQKFILVKKPAEAVALGGCRVCFLYNKNVGLIELVESLAKISK